ncbi:lysylphosphatidylglycerol synthetase family protein, partial [Pyxidicoccus fallax]|nr:lysylphosphatidylglycerol synthetase family protein [Pyxidicoccus fallax]
LLPLSPGDARPLGVGMLALLAAYLVACARVRRPLRVRVVEVRLPRPSLAAAQLAVSCLDWALAALVLWVLLPADAGVSLPGLVALFALAQLAGIASQVPGGLGVFESIILAALSPGVPAPLVLGTLLVYRVVYYLLPFTVAVGLLALHEAGRHREHLGKVARATRDTFAPVVPWVASAAAFISGAVLLFSGATPTVPERLTFLRDLVPLPLMEASHLLGSLVGLALLVLAQGLQRRLDGAFVLTEVALVAGAVFSLVKGVDYEEAALLLVLAVALVPFRSRFHRRASLLEDAFSPGWLLATGAVVAASVGLGLLAYQHVAYSHDLWWRFTFSGDAPRFMRATVGVLGAGLLFGIVALLRPASARVRPPDAAALARVRPLVAHSPESAACLALVGDKSLLFNEQGSAFL